MSNSVDHSPAVAPGDSAAGFSRRERFALFLLTVTCAGYLPSLWWWVHWRNEATTGGSVGIIPLVISLVWLVWGWKQTPSLPVRHPVGALVLLGFSLGGWLVAWVAEASVIQGQMMSLVFAALVWLYGGENKLRALWFPLLYLTLAFPLPALAEPYFSYPLRLWSTQLAGWWLAVAGLPGEVTGTLIRVSADTYDVAPACSGLKTVYAFLVLGLLVARWLHGSGWRFWLQAAFIPVATLLANSLRITALVLLSHWGGKQAAAGFAHETTGVIFFVLLFAAMNWLGQWLARRFPSAPTKVEKPDSDVRWSVSWSAAAGHAVLVLVCLLFVVRLQVQQSRLEAQPAHLDYLLADWRGRDVPLMPQEADFWGAAQVVRRRYERRGELVEMTVLTSRPERRSLHEPVGCYTSLGWHVLTREPAHFGNGKAADGRFVMFEREGERMLAMYWFQSADGELAGSDAVFLWKSLWQRLRPGGAQTWTIVSMATPVELKTETEAKQRLLDLALAVRDELQAARTSPLQR